MYSCHDQINVSFSAFRCCWLDFKPIKQLIVPYIKTRLVLGFFPAPAAVIRPLFLSYFHLRRFELSAVIM